MTRPVLLGFALPLLAAALLAGPARAQSEADMTKMMHQSAYNQLGVLQWFQGKGSVDASAVAMQRRAIAQLPPAKVDGLDAAEAAGKKGVIQLGGQDTKIEDMASQSGMTADAMCRQLAESMKAQDAATPK